MASTKRARRTLILPLLLAGVMAWLFLPGLPLSRASAKNGATTSTQNPASGLDPERQAAMAKLYAQVRAGAPASEEEADILRRFGSGFAIGQLEADIVISRALYAYYISGSNLSKEQEELLGRYNEFVARRDTDVRDRKTREVNRRKAAAAEAPPRNAPLVAPPDDQCAGAEIIPGAGPFPYTTALTGDITDATTAGDPPAPSCQSNVSRSIWYRFTPSASAQYTISSCAGGPTSTTVVDTVMAIYSAASCAGPFTEVPTAVFTDGCDDDTCAVEALQAVITTQLTGGTTYFIVVWQFDTPPPLPGQTSVQLLVTRFLPAANDTCAGVIPLSLNIPVSGTTTSGSTPAATNDYNLSGAGCFTGLGQTASTADGIDVVYSFVAPTAGSYSFRAFDYTTSFSNLVLYVASTCPAATPGIPVTVACSGASNRSPDGEAEEVMCMTLSMGQQVFIYVDEAAATIGSTFKVEVTRCTRETEPNDTPATANALAFDTEGTIGNAADADFFQLGAPATGSRVFALVNGAAGNTRDFDLRVTTTTDTLEFDDSDDDIPFGDLSPNVAGTPLTGVTSFLRVNVNAAAGIASEPYHVYSVVQPPMASATNETEPNNTRAQANFASNLYFKGSLTGPAPSTDVDVFSVNAAAGDLLFVSLDGDPLRDNTPLDARVALLDGTGAVLIEADDIGKTSNTSSGAGSLVAVTPNSPGEAFVFRITQNGPYYVRVAASSINAVPSAAGDYLLSISKNGIAGPTAIKLNDQEIAGRMKATRLSDGVLVEWRTGMELDNLGFNVYREEAGGRVRLNQQLLAGSALMIGPDTALRSGRPYAWIDPSATSAGARYWIEDVDLNGTATMHGPIAVGGSGLKTSSAGLKQATQLSQLGRNNAQENTTATVEPKAALAQVSPDDGGFGLASGPAVKLTVRQAGIYRATQPELVAAGLNPKTDPRFLQLYADGKEVPILVSGDKDGRFDSTDSIEFFGVGLDTASTDAHVYWLIAGSSPGKRITQSSAGASLVGAGMFPLTVERKDRTVYFASLRNGELENFFGAVVAGGAVDQTLNLQHLAAIQAAQATVEVALQGVTNVSHRVRIEINGKPAADLSFEGQSEGLSRFAIPQSALKEGQNLVRLTAIGGSADVSLVDRISVTYWHAMTADANFLRITAQAKQSVMVDGFSNSQVRVFDVTDPSSVQEVVGTIRKASSGFGIGFVVQGSGERTLIAMTNDQAKRASSIAANRPSSWRQPEHAADLVIITRSEFAGAIEPLRSFRQSQGLNTQIVDVEDLFDEFSYGNRSPQALRDFLLYASTNWRLAPRFVLLVGDSSYDPRNYLGLGDYDLVPTRLIDTRLMETASDNWFVSFEGDGASGPSIGRLPVRSAIEAANMVAKIIGYDQAAPADGVLLVADANDGFDFQALNNQLRAFIPASSYLEEVNRAQSNAASERSNLLRALNRGPRVVNYTGHGSSEQWRGGFLTAADAGGLTNRQSLSLFLSMTCLNGYFQDPSVESLAEGLMKSRGGAIAVWASSGMTEPGEQGAMDYTLFKLIFDRSSRTHPATIGDAVSQARLAVSDPDVRRTWILFGDPSTRLR